MPADDRRHDLGCPAEAGAPEFCTCNDEESTDAFRPERDDDCFCPHGYVLDDAPHPAAGLEACPHGCTEKVGRSQDAKRIEASVYSSKVLRFGGSVVRVAAENRGALGRRRVTVSAGATMTAEEALELVEALLEARRILLAVDGEAV